MKYKINEDVIFGNLTWTIIEATERTTVKKHTDNNMADEYDFNTENFYTLKNNKGEVVYNILEEDILENNKEYEFEDSKEYILKDGTSAIYEAATNMLITDSSIAIPGELYDRDGYCSKLEDYSIDYKVDDYEYDFDDDEDDDDDDDDVFFIERNEVGKEDNKEIELNLGEKSTIKIFKTQNGFGVCGVLPDEYKEDFDKFIKKIGEINND